MDDEFSKIAWLRRRLALPGEDGWIGIGDDAAVVPARMTGSVLTVDTQVEDVHFRPGFLSWREVGARAVITATSDIWAMAATPSASLVSLILPQGFGDARFREVVEGVAEAAESTGARVVGGNLSAGVRFSITTTVIGGTDSRIVTRSGARVGDGVFVTGTPGSAALGLALLLQSESDIPLGADFIDRWRRPPVHGPTVLALLQLATAAIDISDGLLQDLGHLCEASDAGAEIYADRLPKRSGYDACCRTLSLDPTILALSGGEDYELLFTAPPTTRDPLVTQIGEIREGSAVTVLDAAGNAIDLDKAGFRHFS